MIHEVLKCIEDDLNQYFGMKLPNAVNNEKKVILSNIVNNDGTSAAGTDRVVLTFYNLEKESAQNGGGTVSSSSSGGPGQLSMNIYIVFAASFTGKRYYEGLMFLSYIIGYFQKKNSFTRSNTPSLGRNIEKLIFEICSLNMEQTNSLWGALGSKHMPFVMYKVRTLSFDESIIQDVRPSIGTISDDGVKPGK